MVKEKFKMDGNHGIYLKLSNGGSATFLPVVARENMDWSIDKYMYHLTKKINNNNKGDEWKKGFVKIYKSKSYTWNTNKQVII